MERFIKVLKDIGIIVLLAILLAGGLVGTRLLLYALGIHIPRLPQQADEHTAVYYLLTGSLLLSCGWFFLIQWIGGGFLEKIAVTTLFILLGFSLGVTIESAIYSDIESYYLTILLLLLPIILYTVTASLLTGTVKHKRPFGRRLVFYFRSWSVKTWAGKVLLAIFAFPVVYFIFGMIAAPFVARSYEYAVEGLRLPEPGTIITVQFLRSILFLIVTIPVIINWTTNRTKLVISLTLSFFVMVFAYDIYLAIAMPMQLVLVHGLEILADSFVYSWILVRLFYPEKPI